MGYRTNRWALAALIERSEGHPSLAAVAREAQASPSTLTDILNGRRDASEDLLGRLAETIDVERRAISADPFGLLDPLEAVVSAARQLAPHLNGHDFGLRDALEELDRVQGAL